MNLKKLTKVRDEYEGMYYDEAEEYETEENRPDQIVFDLYFNEGGEPQEFENEEDAISAAKEVINNGECFKAVINKIGRWFNENGKLSGAKTLDYWVYDERYNTYSLYVNGDYVMDFDDKDEAVDAGNEKVQNGANDAFVFENREYHNEMGDVVGEDSEIIWSDLDDVIYK